jgi:toxin-antitoxin system PIN domain toxin
MRLIDANLLVYAHVKSLSQHHKAKAWLDRVINEPPPVGLAWPSLLGFVRLVTNPRIFERPESMDEAWSQVEKWLSCVNVWIPRPTERHQEILGPFVRTICTKSNLIPDAHIAALGIEHGLILNSSDSDFARFPGLRWENPLADEASEI